MVKAISKMKLGKAAGPSGIVVEMVKAAGRTDATMICCLTSPLIHDGMIPANSIRLSFLVCLYNGKGDALERCNCRVLKLTEQAMKILERRIC